MAEEYSQEQREEAHAPKVPQEVPLVSSGRSIYGGRSSYSHPDRCSYSKAVKLMVVKVALWILEVAWRSLTAFVVNDVVFSQQTVPPVVR